MLAMADRNATATIKLLNVITGVGVFRRGKQERFDYRRGETVGGWRQRSEHGGHKPRNASSHWKLGEARNTPSHRTSREHGPINILLSTQ